MIADPTPLQRRPIDHARPPVDRGRVIRRAGQPVIRQSLVDSYRIEDLIRDEYLSRDPQRLDCNVAPQADTTPSHSLLAVFVIAIALLVPIASAWPGLAW